MLDRRTTTTTTQVKTTFNSRPLKYMKVLIALKTSKWLVDAQFLCHSQALLWWKALQIILSLVVTEICPIRSTFSTVTRLALSRLMQLVSWGKSLSFKPHQIHRSSVWTTFWSRDLSGQIVVQKTSNIGKIVSWPHIWTKIIYHLKKEPTRELTQIPPVPSEG